MFNAPVPPKSELPTPRELLRSTLIAVAAAALLLVTVVLPAEFGIDPTGVGNVLGLKRMGEIKVALAIEAAADAAADSAAAAAEAAFEAQLAASAAGAAAEAANVPTPADTAASIRSDSVVVVLQPDEGREFKLLMREGASVRYQWSTGSGVVNYDTHGDPHNMPAGFYHGYGKGTGTASDEGVLTAAFDGLHGWFWRNRTREVVTVTLRVEGEFQEMREIK